MAIGLLIIWGSGQLARQLIQPKIVGDSVGMPPLPTLFLLYIGYKLRCRRNDRGSTCRTDRLYHVSAGSFTDDQGHAEDPGSRINHFRRPKPEDMDEVRQMQERDRRLSEELARQAAEEEVKKEAQRKFRKKLKKKLLGEKQKEKKS